MSHRYLFASTFALLACLSGGVGLWEALRTPPLNVILLTVEGMRADAVSKQKTPNLWRAAAQGIRFANHRAVSAWTGPNVIALLTGLSPFEQGIHTRGNSIPSQWTLPLEVLAAAGWRIAGIQPFMRIDLFRNLGLSVEEAKSPFSWLTQQALKQKRFFFWSHYVGTHLPYTRSNKHDETVGRLFTAATQDQRARINKVMTQPTIPTGTIKFQDRDAAIVRALYQAGFHDFDDWFGQFWEFFQRSGLRTNTILIVTADHGEELLERGQVGHASTTRAGHLYDEVVRTQMLIWLPPGHVDGIARTIWSRSSHIDVMPTLLGWLGRRPVQPMRGANLLKIADDRVWQAVTSNAGFAEPDPTNLNRFHFSRLEYPWKLHLEIKGGRMVRRRLYDLSKDVGEHSNLAMQFPKKVAEMTDRLMPAMLTMRSPSRAPQSGGNGLRPNWRWPAASGEVRYDDLAGRFRLEWQGNNETEYLIQYHAGDGAVGLVGQLTVRGTKKSFGDVSRRYWNTWIVPYGLIRLRVGPAGQEDRWSDWLELRVRK